MRIERKTGGMLLTSGDSYLEMKNPIIVINGQERQCSFTQSRAETDREEIGNTEGSISVDREVWGSLCVERQIYQSKGENLAGIRMIIRNEGTFPLRLERIHPFQCEGDKSLMVGNSRMQDCRFLKLGRHKLDIPGVFSPAVRDQNYLDAAFQAEKMTAGGGVQKSAGAFVNIDQIFSEPLCYIKSEKNPMLSGVALLSLGQKKHLSSFVLIPDSKNRKLKRFYAVCEFDGVRLDPGESRQTHWILIYNAQTEQEAIERYTKLLMTYLGTSAPNGRETLFCSWYFYGREFREKDLEENLKYLRDQPMPVDAFIIDNGWMDNFGDWNAGWRFPGGMQAAADKIRDAGMQAGIWTCPFIIMPKSKQFHNHPELIAKTRKGEDASFQYVEGTCKVVDTTHPYCKEYYQELYDRLKKWGYTYHKLDFMRAPVVDETITFWNPHMNRAQAYRRGHELLRDVLGPDAYILSCGGIYDAADLGEGLVNSVRSGSDSIGSWEHPSGEHHAGTLVQIKQAMVRNYLNKFVNLDPDSLMLRRRETPFQIHETEKHNWLSDGKFTDEEAESLVAKQYICGGNVNFSERLAELPKDRRKLLSLIIPPVIAAAKILDYQNSLCPSMALSEVESGASGLPGWYTLSVSNWSDESVVRAIEINELGLKTEESLVVFELFTQKFLGVFHLDQSVLVKIPAHGTRILRLAETEGHLPVISGTDAHLSGGGYELLDVKRTEESVSGRVRTCWEYPVVVSAVFPDDDSWTLKQCVVRPGKTFVMIK